ncbi:hypothetical protein [Glycomyces buryatensis]|uniref:Uncharacterized protein n=1 Tax=Glycomyces buryatensis TaxID=2570927 RepID=A0A4S8Q817_9ACTN|nr:hypothetical protein [Glycomyces buryatensis]THV40513.1 hypothetical protein FAB82_14670 [Glycomyces buryatensis]
MGMKDRLGRIAQSAKDAGTQVKEEAAGAKAEAVSAAGDRVGAVRQSTQARVDSAKGAAALGAGAVTDRAVAGKELASGYMGDVKASLEEMNFAQFFDRLPVPTAPVAAPWRFSVSKLITEGEKPPKGTGLLLKQLDRFGAIDIGPDEVGFDDTTAKWPKVKAIRTRSLDGIIEMLTAEGVADTISASLPGIPGKGWAADKVTSIIFTIGMMVTEMAMRDPEAARRQYVCEIEYKGWIRTKEAVTGYFTGPCMALVPGLDEVFRAEAQRHGVAIEAAPSTSLENAQNRTAWLRDKQAALLARRENGRKQIEY